MICICGKCTGDGSISIKQVCNVCNAQSRRLINHQLYLTQPFTCQKCLVIVVERSVKEGRSKEDIIQDIVRELENSLRNGQPDTLIKRI